MPGEDLCFWPRHERSRLPDGLGCLAPNVERLFLDLVKDRNEPLAPLPPGKHRPQRHPGAARSHNTKDWRVSDQQTITATSRTQAFG